MLADLWQEILQVEKVGIYDDFFDLGGHSLLATRIITRLNKAFQIELSVMGLFENANVAGLAAAVEETLLKEVNELAEPGTEVLIFDKELLEQKNYWVERLSGCLAQVSLPGVTNGVHTVKVNLRGNQSTVFYDGVLMTNVTDNNFDGTPDTDSRSGVIFLNGRQEIRHLLTSVTSSTRKY